MRIVLLYPRRSVADDDPFQGYIDTFLLKFTCGEPDCFGTLAPVKGTDRMECNLCGHQRTEQEFLEELHAFQ